MDWEYLLKRFGKGFYTEPFMYLIVLSVIVFYFTRTWKRSPMMYLAILALASFFQVTLVDYDSLYHKHSILGKNIEQTTIYLYLIIELNCCLLFISAHLRSENAKKLLLAGSILFTISILTYWRLHPLSRIYPWYITISEGVLIIGCALFYFYELFSHNPELQLSREPSFWPISGMLMMYCAITPLFLIFNYIRKADLSLTYKLYSINNVSYSLLFLTFLIAMRLEQKRTSVSLP